MAMLQTSPLTETLLPAQKNYARNVIKPKELKETSN